MRTGFGTLYQIQGKLYLDLKTSSKQKRRTALFVTGYPHRYRMNANEVRMSRWVAEAEEWKP